MIPFYPELLHGSVLCQHCTCWEVLLFVSYVRFVWSLNTSILYIMEFFERFLNTEIFFFSSCIINLCFRHFLQIKCLGFCLLALWPHPVANLMHLYKLWIFWEIRICQKDFFYNYLLNNLKCRFAFWCPFNWAIFGPFYQFSEWWQYFTLFWPDITIIFVPFLRIIWLVFYPEDIQDQKFLVLFWDLVRLLHVL